jgi:hypothetical protein
LLAFLSLELFEIRECSSADIVNTGEEESVKSTPILDDAKKDGALAVGKFFPLIGGHPTV